MTAPRSGAGGQQSAGSALTGPAIHSAWRGGTALDGLILERLRAQLVRHQFTLALVPGRPAVSLAQHERIVAAITAGDPHEAEAAMLDHISSVIETLNGLPGEPAGRARSGSAGPGPGR